VTYRISQNGKVLKQKTAAAISIVVLVVALLFVFVGANLLSNEKQTEPSLFIGVDIASGNETCVYRVADAVSGVANLIILGSLSVTEDTEALTRVCDYLYERDFYFIIYVGFAVEGIFPPRGPDPDFFNTTAKQWGDKFLGAYMFDEPGGKQIDLNHPPAPEADNFTDISMKYTYNVKEALDAYVHYYGSSDLKLYTSDYALYWYDYLAGYDVVFGEFVGNQSRQIAASLCRGAAHTFNKEWGIMITWQNSPDHFIESPEQLFSDMILAYNNHAKYIVIFNGFENLTAPTPLGTLTEEHIEVMQQFLNYAENNPRSEVYPAHTAFVLPSDYGYGFRGPSDRIWGHWESDDLSPQIWNDTNELISAYGTNLDIVYETCIGNHPVTLPYNRQIFWNGTVIDK
jgi:hypothetical protein